jgi:hypothetical protein
MAVRSQMGLVCSDKSQGFMLFALVSRLEVFPKPERPNSCAHSAIGKACADITNMNIININVNMTT